MAKRRNSGVILRPEIKVIIAAIVLFFAVCFSAGGFHKAAAIVFMLAALAALVFSSKSFAKCMNPQLMLLVLITVFGGLSSFWAISGKFALNEFDKLALALGASLVLMAFLKGKSDISPRRMAQVLAICAALASFMSIDAISTRFFTSILKIVPGSYFREITGIEEGVRIISIFRNPNIFAGCAGIGVLLGLYLVTDAENGKQRKFDLCCLFINSVAFLLAFSMGASAAIVVGFVVYIVLEYSERKPGLLVTMILTLVFAAVNVVIISATSFDAWDGIDVVPVLSLAVLCALFCLAYSWVMPRLTKRISGKSVIIVLIVIVVLLAAFVLAAYNITGAVTIEGGSTISRAAYPESGEYTLEAAGGEGAVVTVRSQNRIDTMMHTSTVIYNGALHGASFTVPEDSIVVYFEIHSDETVTLQSVEYKGEQSGTVPLGYKLLPDFIANRLQGLFANQNAIQRFVFFEDGIKLFKTSPIIGRGLGAFGSAIKSVQSFYYETNYVHNHYIQSLLETGIIGLVLFVLLLVSSFVFVLKARKKDKPMVPALGALVCFMAVHSAVEVVFSTTFYLVLAFGVFAITGLVCADEIKIPGKKIKAAFCIILAVFLIVFCVLLGLNMRAASMAKRSPTFNTIEKAVNIDVFEWEDYALSYVLSTMKEAVDANMYEKAEKLAERLSKVDSNTVAFQLAKFYMGSGNIEETMRMAKKHAAYCSSSSDEWNNIFELLMPLDSVASYYPEYTQGMHELVDIMQEWDNANIGTIELSDSVVAFVERYK